MNIVKPARIVGPANKHRVKPRAWQYPGLPARSIIDRTTAEPYRRADRCCFKATGVEKLRRCLSHVAADCHWWWIRRHRSRLVWPCQGLFFFFFFPQVFFFPPPPRSRWSIDVHAWGDEPRSSNERVTVMMPALPSSRLRSCLPSCSNCSGSGWKTTCSCTAGPVVPVRVQGRHPVRDYGGTLDQTLDEIRRINPADVEGYRRTAERFQENPQSRLRDVVGCTVSPLRIHAAPGSSPASPGRLAYGSGKWSCRRLDSDYLRQAFFRSSRCWSAAIRSITTSIYGLIHFLERAHGVHFAMGGTGALVDGLEKADD